MKKNVRTQQLIKNQSPVSLPNSASEGNSDRQAGLLSLYEMAKAKSWNVSSALAWPVKNLKSRSPLRPQANLFSGFPAYELLGDADKIEIQWQQHEIDICNILCGERAALRLSGQLFNGLESEEARLFLATQIFDEARHVEFFARYQREFSLTAHAPGNSLTRLLNDAIEAPDIDHKILVCQVIIESLAMAKFRQLKQESRIPLLQEAIGLIARDEARHVKFGVDFYCQRLSLMSPEQRQEKTDFVISVVVELASHIRQYLLVADQWQWDKNELLRHLRSRRRQQPALLRQSCSHLKRNLSSMGLPTVTRKGLQL